MNYERQPPSSFEDVDFDLVTDGEASPFQVLNELDVNPFSDDELPVLQLSAASFHTDELDGAHSFFEFLPNMQSVSLSDARKR